MPLPLKKINNNNVFMQGHIYRYLNKSDSSVRKSQPVI